MKVKVSLFLISFLLLVSNGAWGQDKFVERSTDVLCVAPTATGLIKAVVEKDKKGMIQLGLSTATTLALKDESEELGASYVLTLNGDGTGQFVDEEDISYITWELTEDGFRTKGDTKLRFTDDGDNIKTNIIGVDMIFERQ